MVETSEEFMKLAYVTLSYEIVSEKRGTVSHSLARSRSESLIYLSKIVVS